MNVEGLSRVAHGVVLVARACVRLASASITFGTYAATATGGGGAGGAGDEECGISVSHLCKW